MKLYLRINILVLALLHCNTLAEEFDPFGDTLPALDERITPKMFETTGHFKVTPATEHNPPIIHPDEWSSLNLDKIENPSNFNRHFDKPSTIWRTDGGYFASFDGGEWGGALFYATDGDVKWTRIVNTHIKDLERFDHEQDTFLAAGGLAHLGLSGGSAYIISRRASGEWNSRIVFRSDLGVPRIAGTTFTDIFLKAKAKRLIAIKLENPLGSEPLFGIDITGAIHYLGEIEE